MTLIAAALLLGCAGSDKSAVDDTTSAPDDTGPVDSADDKGGDDTGEDDTGPDEDGAIGCEDARFAGLVAAIEADLEASDAPGVSVAVMESGEITFACAFGAMASGSDVVPTPHTLFQIGSTTKMLTAIALLQKVADGAVSLDDTLADALPDSDFALDPDWNDEVLLQHLLTHQGAFYDYIDWTAGPEDEDLAAWHTDVFFPNLWLMADPGEFWNYSNPNFDLAGLIAEHHDGRYYPDLMMEDVFSPLAMDRTFQRLEAVEADGDAAEGVGYIVTAARSTYGPVALEKVPDLAHARPAGAGTWTTPRQMMEVARFLMEGDAAVLPDALREQMMTPQVQILGVPWDMTYGYGLFLHPGYQLGDEWYVTPVWEHGGNTLSYTSIFHIIPEHGVAISVLSSGYGTDFSASAAAAIEATVVEPEATTVPEYSFDPDSLDDHTGDYNDAYNVGPVIVTREGDGLVVSMPLLDELEMAYEPELWTVASDVFYFKIEGTWYDLTFLPGEEGAGSRYIRNRAFVATRSDGDAEAVAPPTASADARDALRRRLMPARVPRVPLFAPRPPVD